MTREVTNKKKFEVALGEIQKLDRDDLEVLAMNMFLKISCYYEIVGIMPEVLTETGGIPPEAIQKGIDQFDKFASNCANSYERSVEGN